jgi:hypothetical protein
MIKNKLKACPHCGWIETEDEKADHIIVDGAHCLQCRRCKAVGPQSFEAGGEITKWNKRAGDREPGASKETAISTLRSKDGLGEPNLTLTIEEIRDLAGMCGLVVKDATDEEKEDERVTKITISPWPEMGVWDEEQKCKVPPHKHISRYEEYPEEGCAPLGSPNGGTQRREMAAGEQRNENKTERPSPVR